MTAALRVVLLVCAVAAAVVPAAGQSPKRGGILNAMATSFPTTRSTTTPACTTSGSTAERRDQGLIDIKYVGVYSGVQPNAFKPARMVS